VIARLVLLCNCGVCQVLAVNYVEINGAHGYVCTIGKCTNLLRFSEPCIIVPFTLLNESVCTLYVCFASKTNTMLSYAKLL
jgi:hypothetical protein